MASSSKVATVRAEGLACEKGYLKGVKYLCDNGITGIPQKYVLPVAERPAYNSSSSNNSNDEVRDMVRAPILKLPTVDAAKLQGPNRNEVLKSLAKACGEHGFFQVINHGIPSKVLEGMMKAAKGFFELPYEERSRFMGEDMTAPVRYGTSYNQNNDGVFCWRDFLKLYCTPLSQTLPLWPSDLRVVGEEYARETKALFFMLMEAVMESLGIIPLQDEGLLKEMKEGSQMLVLNCFPTCPEPELTLGMLPHSDYGFLTLLLQDEVEGLQVQLKTGDWFTLPTLSDSFVINVGDHLEIFSNGKYKSVLHRVLANRSKTRISVASLHSLPFETVIGPAPQLIDQCHPPLYANTDFASFLHYISSTRHHPKSFLESRKLKLDT
ncbi:hypothetical protein AMTRI_Chr07g78630 [Amborella trichopoda]|uniref:Fe2OG dioxygenase domain-containing protein n=1 Tax=Amborella trichopoda TaxID=13333 RepID=W1PZ85_AMBTC|nr:protein DMR6-LIKE OXYGENASE 2 [Amborella trichopoda]ERN12885.1 hypothetical protein AMTR_s00050p00146920 [Amborella trichopoda]|eukprot:XP_020527232.1 protein DMR6-LIKE OXYGENASE 2 [Amborella trichopoda]